MGRPRKNNPLNLPPRVYAKHGAFYYHHPAGRWERIGKDVDQAKRRASEILNNLKDGYGKVPYWLDEFLGHCRDRVALKILSERTLEDYTDAAEKLKVWFADYYPVGVESKHVGDYLDKGLELGRPVRANRERACLSAMYTWLKRKGHAGVKENPCLGVRRNKETGRDRYVEHEEMAETLELARVQVWGLAHLVYRTLQRPEDIITWTARNITERRDASGKVVRIIRTQQGKTAAHIDIEITPEIDAILARLKAASTRAPKRGEGKIVGLTLVHRRDGKPYSYDGLCSMLKRNQETVRDLHAIKRGPLEEMAPWGFYDLKGKGATDMWLAGRPLEVIQVLCGHESITTTEIYVKSRWRGIVSPNQVTMAV